jgi:hypothetical protein
MSNLAGHSVNETFVTRSVQRDPDSITSGVKPEILVCAVPPSPLGDPAPGSASKHDRLRRDRGPANARLNRQLTQNNLGTRLDWASGM